MDIENFLPYHPTLQDPSFHERLNHLKEFAINKLPVTESIPDIQGVLLKHQEEIKAFMIPNSGYNELFLWHEVGTGKSCTAFAVTESNIFNKQALVLCPNTDGINVLMDQLVNKCTDGTFEDNYKVTRKYAPKYESFIPIQWIKTQMKDYAFLTSSQQKQLQEMLIHHKQEEILKKSMNDLKKEKKESEDKFSDFLNKDIDVKEYMSIKKVVYPSIQTILLQNPEYNKWYYENKYYIDKVQMRKDFDWNEKYDIIMHDISNLKDTYDGSQRKVDNERKKNIKTKYEFHTHTIFFRKLAKLKDDQIIKKYSNIPIIVDEAHKLLSGDDTAEKYTQAKRLFSLVKNCKKILLSATPMIDQFTDFPRLMNLIIPVKLPEGEEFKDLYFDKQEKETNISLYTIKKNKIKDLGDKIGKYVSYLKAQTNVPVTYLGENIGKITKFNLFKEEMS